MSPCCACCRTCYTTRVGLGVTLAVLVPLCVFHNLHFLLLGRGLATALVSSHAFSATNTLVLLPLLSALLRAQGVPVGGNRTEQYAVTQSGRPLLVDVYEPTGPASAGRPAVLYLHAGAFNTLGRELCGGHLCWLAAYGVVGFSASYRLTNSPDGDGVAGAIDDAWSALRWLRTNSRRLHIDPRKIVVWGDSAGGGLALSLGTGLRPGLPPAPRHELPAAVLAGFPVTTFGSRSFLMQKSTSGRRFGRSRWEETPAASQMRMPNVFVPASTAPTAADAQAQLRHVFAGMNLYFGQRRPGGLLLPADGLYPMHDDAASVSPLSLARRRHLPPMLVLSAANDTVVPLGQQERFVEQARIAGNAVAHLIFEGADHGEGGVYTPAGREATLTFLHALAVLPAAPHTRRADAAGVGVACIDAAARGLGIQLADFAPSAGFRWWAHKRSTLRIRPR